jgi:ribosomal protein S18 acetylase RimI-like enzyme
MTYLIVPLHIKDIPKLAYLHCRLFPGSRSTLLGKLYVKKMFRWFQERFPSLSYVAKEDQEIIGYVVGSIGGFGRPIFRYAFVEIVLGFIFHPALWFNKRTYLLWRSYLAGLFPPKAMKVVLVPKVKPQISIALAGIGVAASQQGKGIGKALTMAFEKAARSMGAAVLTLSVDDNNISARKVYEACGWVKDGEYEEAHSVHYSKKIA